MADIKKLLEAMDQFAGEKVGQKPGDQVRGTEKATKKKSGEHPFKGRLVGASESILKELGDELKESAPKRDLAEEFAQFKSELDEFATDPKYWKDDNGGGEFAGMSLAEVAKSILLLIGDEYTVERGARKDQPSFKFVPKDPNKFGAARIWSALDRRGNEYPTYNTILFAHGTGKHAEKTVVKNNKNATRTAELIYNNALAAPTVKEAHNPRDTVTMDVPLMIRMLEYAREDAKTDMDLHDVAERMIKLSAEGRTLTMQDYDTICPQKAVDESWKSKAAATALAGAALAGIVASPKLRVNGVVYDKAIISAPADAKTVTVDGKSYKIWSKHVQGPKQMPHEVFLYQPVTKDVNEKKTFDETKGLKKRVRIVKGNLKGQTGTIGEVRHGLYKGAPKKYTIDLDGGGNIMLPGDALRLIKEPVEEQVTGTAAPAPGGTGTMAGSGTNPAQTAGGPAGSTSSNIQPQGTSQPAKPGQAANPQQVAQLAQQKANLQKNVAQLKSAGVNVDPARAAQTLQKTDTGAPMNAQDKDTLSKLGPALGNVLGRPDLSAQLNTLIKKASGGAQ